MVDYSNDVIMVKPQSSQRVSPMGKFEVSLTLFSNNLLNN